MVKILICYLHAKKVMALCLKVQIFLAKSMYSKSSQKIENAVLKFLLFRVSDLCTVILFIILCQIYP